MNQHSQHQKQSVVIVNSYVQVFIRKTLCIKHKLKELHKFLLEVEGSEPVMLLEKAILTVELPHVCTRIVHV